MHIEAGVVDGAKMMLGYATAAASLGVVLKVSFDTIKQSGFISYCVKALFSIALVFAFFEVLPHKAVGVSEVHLIMGSTLFLLFGLAPAAIGLAAGLLIQGLFFAPFDLPQYGLNVTTLLVPLFAMSIIANRIIPKNIAYTELKYSQALALSTSYQAGIVAWVAFWAFYGQGFGVENLNNVMIFSGAYMSVILIEPLVDLAVLAIAKQAVFDKGIFDNRLHNAASA